MVLCCSCLESCCSAAEAQTIVTPSSASSVQDLPAVKPNVSRLGRIYTEPSAPSDDDIAFFNAPNGIRAALECFNEVADLQTKTLELLEVRKALLIGFQENRHLKFLVKCKVVGTDEIIHVKGWYLVTPDQSQCRTFIFDVLRNKLMSDRLELF